MIHHIRTGQIVKLDTHFDNFQTGQIFRNETGQILQKETLSKSKKTFLQEISFNWTIFVIPISWTIFLVRFSILVQSEF